jgi:hypothetical protein
MNRLSVFLKDLAFNKNFYFLFVIIFFSLIYLQSFGTITISYFYTDHRLIEHLHNINLDKNLFEVLVNTKTINGVPFTPHNPSLNLLSFLNYNLESYKTYQAYILIVRVLEFSIIMLYVWLFSKSFKPNLIYIFIFIAIQTTFSIFDHHSYISFPILIFQFFLILGLVFRKNIYLFVFFNFLGTFWSFFINPMYFFIVCAGPLMFFYIYFFLKKEFKTISILFFINLPFAIFYSLLAIGTSRFNLSQYLLPVEGHYNFSIFTGKLFILMSVITIFSFYFFKRKSLEILVFFIFIFLSFCIGIIYENELFKWLLPSPIYIDYALKCIYIAVFMITGDYLIRSRFKNYYLLFLVFIFAIKFHGISTKFLNFNSKAGIENNYDYADLKKRFFWEKDEKIFLSNYKNKTIFVDVPNYKSEYTRYILPKSEKFNTRTFQHTFATKIYNEKFKHSLNDFDYQKELITVNLGHSLLMDNSTYFANMESLNNLYPKEHVPSLKYNSPIVKYIYKPDYIFSDIKIKNYQIEKIYDFKDYKFYLYKNSNLEKNYQANKIIKIKNFKDYLKDIKNFDKNLYLLEIDKFPNKMNICKILRDHSNLSKLKFEVLTNKECIAIFPIPFSYNNNFIKKDGNKCDTFRVQYHFHGCVFKNNDNIELKKNNIFYYAINSFKDFLELKKLNII